MLGAVLVGFVMDEVVNALPGGRLELVALLSEMFLTMRHALRGDGRLGGGVLNFLDVHAAC